jgi:hypothetical protein
MQIMFLFVTLGDTKYEHNVLIVNTHLFYTILFTFPNRRHAICCKIVLTHLLTYVLTYLLTYLLTCLLTYLLTYLLHAAESFLRS